MRRRKEEEEEGEARSNLIYLMQTKDRDSRSLPAYPILDGICLHVRSDLDKECGIPACANILDRDKLGLLFGLEGKESFPALWARIGKNSKASNLMILLVPII
jgi:hypothetical protein